MKHRVEILYEDNDLVVVNKPANYLSVQDRFKPELPHVTGYLKKKYEEIFTVHRLDSGTSGIMLFAKNSSTHRSLSLQFENREVEKHYLALVEGTFSKKEGRIDRPIAESSSRRGKMVIHKKGKSAITEFSVREEFKYYTLLDVSIRSGRTHQIRIHMKSYGHPLAVDKLYNGKDGFYLSQVKRNFRKAKDEEERPLMNRTSLHAFRIKFTHPGNGNPVEFEADLPKDFRAVLNQLRKWGI